MAEIESNRLMRVLEWIAQGSPRRFGDYARVAATTVEEIQASEDQRLKAVRRYDILDTPPDGAFDRITALAAEHFHVPISIVSVVDEDRIWFKSHHGVDVQEVGRDPGLCASAIMQYEPWVVENAAVDPRTLTNPLVAEDFGLRFYAGVPLTTSEGHNLGTLCIIDREPRDFSDRDATHLQDLAMIVMDELELRVSAREVIAAEQGLREESERVTSVLQRSLLPGRLPCIPGAEVAALFQPASRFEVGGDFYDCFALSQDRWALIVGDVTGKGAEAAALTGMVRHAARTAAITGHPPDGVLATINRVLLSAQEETDGRLATLVYVEVARTDTGFAIEVACGGHAPPLLGREGTVVEARVTPNPPLGAIPHGEIHSSTATLQPGDSLMIYTDGLSEARLDGAFVGTARVATFLRQHHGERADGIIEALHSFVTTITVRDDIAALVFKVKPAASR